MDTAPVNLASDDVWHAAVLQQLRKKFTSLMRRLHIASQGAQLAISLLEEPEAQDFITTHASILDSSFAQTSMSEAMRTSLQKSDYIFSGIKTFHELNEAFPSLLDENGNRKPFEQFLNDVRKIDEKYNINYLRAEYNFCQQSANMAAKWEQFQADGDRYNLQYRTAGDDHVRPAHAALDRITLPPSHPFWEKYFPPNGWNCRCTVVQVRKSKYPQTPDSDVEHLIEATVPDGSPSGKEDMFRFNPGIEKKTVPDYNPYTIRRCQDCDIAKGKVNLAFVPENELCGACRIVRALANADAKQTRRLAKPLQGTSISAAHFPHPIKISRASITEWTNQPNKFYQEKNKMLLRINEVLENRECRYLGPATLPPEKQRDRLVCSHIFSTKIKGEEQCIIVWEWDWGEYVLHSISDHPEKIKKYIINK